MFRTFIILGLTLIMSCGNEKNSSRESTSSPRIKKFSKVTKPKNNTDLPIGTEVSFKIESSQDIDSVALEYEKESATFTSSEFDWSPKHGKTGNQRIRLTVYSGKETETHYVKLRFLSDMAPEEYTYELIGMLPHDQTSYTQGLFFIGDTLVESTGRKGQSKLSKLNLTSATPYESTSIGNQYFGEGSTIWNNRIIMLTWTSGIGFVFDRKLQEQKTFHYSHEGWGITTYGDTLLVSDGSETIHMLDPRDFSETGKLQVYDDKGKIIALNELEMIEGLLYANVYQEDLIVVIDPKTGKLLSKIDMTGLSDKFDSRDIDVLNGIAYHESSKQIYVTGKLWPQMFQVQFVPKK